MKRYAIFILSIILSHAHVVFSHEANSDIKNAVVIGSGPAGLAAALYLANVGFEPVVVGGSVGGILMSSGPLENWSGHINPTGPMVMSNAHEQVLARGATFLDEWVTDVDFSQRPFAIHTDMGREIKTHTVIVATGTLPKKLECPGEQEYWGKGVTSCTLCDGPLYVNKKAAVIGGGDMAMLRAIFLANYTTDITIIHHSEKLSASSYWQNKIKEKPFIQMMLNTDLLEIKGDDKKVTGLLLKNKITNEESHFPVDGLFIAIGSKPCTDIFKGQLKMERDESVCVCDRFTKTSVEGVFVAGNAADHGYRSAMAAAGTGIMAGIDAANYLTLKLGKDRALHSYFFCEKHS